MNLSPPNQPAESAAGRRLDSALIRQILVLTLIRVVINTGFRFVYPFLPVLGRGLGVGLPAVAQAVSLRSFVAATGPFLGTIADVRGRRFGMLLGLGLFVLGLLLLVVWPTFPTFVLALLLTAFGKSVFDPALLAYLSDRVPYERRGLAMGLTETGWSLSFIVGVPLMGYLIARQGWAAPFPVLAALSLLAIPVLLRLLAQDDPSRAGPSPNPGGAVASASGRAQIWQNLKAVLASPASMTVLGAGVLMSGANEMINLVFGVWMEASFGLQITALGAASLVIGAAELGGETLVSGFTDRFGKSRAVAGGLLLNCLAAAALPLLGGSTGTALAGLFFFYLTFEFSLVSLIPMISEVLPSARATLMASNAAALLLGRALGALGATRLYLSAGILGSAAAVLALNLVALALLQAFRRWEGR